MVKNTFYGFLVLLGIVGLFLGVLIKQNYLIIAGFVLIIVGFIVFLFKKITYSFRSKKVIKNFIAKFPKSEFVINEEFFNNYGKIPFEKITCLSTPSKTINMFQNKYPVRIGFNKFVAENQIGFLLQTKKLIGYHHIIERNVANKIAKGMVEFATGGKSPEIKSDIEEINQNFILLSNNASECNKLVAKIYPELLEIQNIFKKMDFAVSVDNIPTSFDIQIKNSSFLFRINYSAGFLVEDIYQILIKIQKKLS